MASRGIWQLKRLQVFFCEHSGASKGMRELLKSQKIQEFCDNNPQLEYEFIERKGRRPQVVGTYINGYVKHYFAENKKSDEIIENFIRMRNSFGRQRVKFGGLSVYSTTKSVQGKWTPNMWNTYPKHELETLRPLPPIDFIIQPRLRLIEAKQRRLLKNNEFNVKPTLQKHEKQHYESVIH